MGRPSDREDLKTATLHFRVTPTLKIKLETEARLSGRKLSAECEHRLWSSMAESDVKSSPETDALLEAIRRNIWEIEQAMGGEWRRDVATWTAVREMLFWGPVNDLKFSDRQLLRRLQENSDRREQIRSEKQSLVDGLALFGIRANLMPQNTLQSAMLRALSGDPDQSPRSDDRSAVERATIPEDLKVKARRMVDRLVELDVEEQENDEQRADIVEPIREGIEKGRATYDRPNVPEPLEVALSLLLSAR